MVALLVRSRMDTKDPMHLMSGLQSCRGRAGE